MSAGVEQSAARGRGGAPLDDSLDARSDGCGALVRLVEAELVAPGTAPTRCTRVYQGRPGLVGLVLVGLVLVGLVLAGACSEAEPMDLRLLTPKSTAETLLEVYGVANVSEEEVRRRMRIGRSFHLNDPETRARCFLDLDESTPEAEGLVGYVFGSLASGKSDLEVTITGDVAHVFGKDESGRRSRPVVMRRGNAGWKIVLSESVPVAIRRRLATGVRDTSESGAGVSDTGESQTPTKDKPPAPSP